MAAPFRLGLVAGCRLDKSGEDSAGLATPRGPVAVDPSLCPVVERLLAGGDTEAALTAQVAEGAGYAGLRALFDLLFDLHRRLLLVRAVGGPEAPLLAGVPLSGACRFSAGRVDGAARHLLSRCALLRRHEGGLALESPLSRMRVAVGAPEGVRLLGALAAPRTAAELAAAAGLTEETAGLALDLLAYADLLAVVDAEGGEREPEASPALATWEFHDLLFHARSRIGRHAGGYGGTFPGRGRFAPLPDLKPDEAGETVELPRPDLESLRQRDLPFTRVLEERRSRRAFGEPPITLGQLGELLYRAMRVTHPILEGVEAARRLYPGGGGAYELEVYLAAGRCHGLDPGLYRYRPASHSLARLAGLTPRVARLLESAHGIGRATTPVQALLLLAARFGRLAYKYESIAYATLLKDVGAVLQTIYLVATAMGLATCAVGGGDSELFAQAAGTDPWVEATVGEMLLGSRA